MKKFYLSLVALFATTSLFAQGWPANYDGVMLQGFYWDSYRDSKWTNLESQADELSQYFKLVWIPQSAYCGGKSMGYNDLYWFTNYNSSFGTEGELRNLIQTFKSKGIGTIADVVINHRNTLTSYFDFPEETYKGVTYKMYSTDVCADDDKGATKTWADKHGGYKLSSYLDSGEGWDSMRDLDHNSSNVQTVVKVYLNMLLNDFGYAGFRYDMVKGYAGKFTGIYNDATKPTYSVGEYWEGNVDKVKKWLDDTKVNDQITSAAFDFPIRYSVRDAINSNWNTDINGGVATDNSYKQYAVTFVENHDTQYRSSSEQNDPIKKDIPAANAFIMACSGTPCVFYKHWLTYKDDIKKMINARKAAGINNNSATTLNAYRGTNYRSVMTKGTTGSLLAILGSGAKNCVPTSYVEILSGDNYRYFLSKKTEIAWVDLPSGDYEEEQKAKLVAVTNNTSAKLVYTTDGSTPTASSKQVASGTEVEIPLGKTTLKVGLLYSGSVSSIVTREYNITKPEPFVPYDITVYVNADQLGWNNGINFWAWEDASNENLTTSKTWPGDLVTQYKMINGKKWYYHSYNIKSRNYMVSFVFSLSNGEQTIPQTDDVADITKDTYLEIQNAPKGTDAHMYYDVKNVTEEVATGIADAPIIEKQNTDQAWYTLSGMKMMQKPNQAGIYIHQGKKIVVK